MKFPKAIWIFAPSLLLLSPALADDAITNVMSSIVSYQYPDDFSSEALTNGGLMSPIASYQYFEWPGNDVLQLNSSPWVSYFYATGGASPVVSAGLSGVLVSPGSLPADGQSAATVTVRLLNGNGNPVAGKMVRISAVEQASSGGVATLTSVTQPASPTDGNGQATATLTSAVVGTAIISAQDVTDGISLLGQPTVHFTSALVAPNSDLNQAIVALYQSSVNSFGDNATVGANAATYGDQFRAALATDEAAAVLDAIFGVVGAVSAGLDSVKYAGVLALPGLEETGTGPLIKDSAVLSRLFDTELLDGNLSSRVLASGFREIVVSVGGPEAAQDLTDAMVTSGLEQIASQATGLSQVSQATAQKCQLFQQGLQQQEQALLSQGIPPLSAVRQTAWANDLQLRSGVGAASLGVLLQQDHFLMQLSAARQVDSGNAIELILAKFAVEAAATVLFDGPGALVTGGIFSLSDEYKDVRNASTDKAGYNTAFSVVGGCLQYDGQTYLNAASAYNEISQARSANAVTAQVGQMTDWEEGYDAWGPLRLILKFSVTKAYSLLDLKNTSSMPATFEVIVLSGYASSAYGLSIPNLSQVSIGVMNIPGGAEVQIPVTYYDGQNGGKPDPSSQMVVYVLGNNASGTFYAGKFTHDWNPAIAAAKGQFAKPQSPGPRPMDIGSDMENPVVTYVTQNAADQTYQARVFVVNPYNQTYSAIVTQALPAGISVVATDGAVFGSSVVWTNVIPGGGLAKDYFTFRLSLAPGASTNLPPATATFIDLTNNAGSLLSSVVPGFAGLFPVQVSGSVPRGISGSDVPMVLTVTNWTSTNQAGLISVVVADSGGVQVANFALPFSLGGLANTNLTFILPGTLPPASYSVTGSLSINGGGGQVLAGLYVVPAAPITLGAGSTAAGSAGGFTMILQGPIGFSCLIEASTNLVDWQPIQYFVATTSPAYFTDFSATYYNQRFYRAVPLSQVQLPVVPQFGAVRLVSGGGVQVTLLGGVGQAYTVQASTNLVNWVAITNLVLSTGSGQFTDYSATNCPQRFYRAVVP